MNALPPPVGAWARSLEGIRRELAVHVATIDGTRGIIGALPGDALLAGQSNYVRFAVDYATGSSSFVFERSAALARIAPEADGVLTEAVALLDRAGALSLTPTATMGGIGSILSEAAQRLGATDALVGARLTELLGAAR